MGCASSKNQSYIHDDDSIQVMLRREEKMASERGLSPLSYKPRPVHPLLIKPNHQTSGGSTFGGTETDEEYADESCVFPLPTYIRIEINQ